MRRRRAPLAELVVAALSPGGVDVRRDTARGELTVASDQRLVDSPVLLDRALERRARARCAQAEGVSGVCVDRANDRPTDLAPEGLMIPA